MFYLINSLKYLCQTNKGKNIHKLMQISKSVVLKKNVPEDS